MKNNLTGIGTIRRENAKKLMKEHGLSRVEFSEKTGINYTLLGHYIGKNPSKNIGDETAEKIVNAFGMPKNWLDHEHENPRPYSEPNAILTDKEIDVWTDGDTPPDGMIAIDFLPNITASLGHGYINEEFTETSKLWFSENTINRCNVNSQSAKAIHVAGDSMLPELTDGQVIAIDTSAKRIFDGEIYAFRKGDEIKVKYLFKTNDGFKAVSRNDDKLRYPDEIYTATDIANENIEILGQFWWKSETRRIKR